VLRKILRTLRIVFTKVLRFRVINQTPLVTQTIINLMGTTINLRFIMYLVINKYITILFLKNLAKISINFKYGYRYFWSYSCSFA
jgi:hypothetical protein